MIDREQIDEILAMCEKATPGPWKYDGMHQEITTPHGDDFWLIVSECRTAPDQEYQCDQFGHNYDANYAFIAQARTILPALAADYKAMLGLVEAARKMQVEHCLGSCSGAMCRHCAMNPIREALAAMEGGVT